MGQSVIELLLALGVQPVAAHKFCRAESLPASALLSRSLYWQYSKELVGALALALPKVHGVIFLTAFPCGPDSLVTELMLRKITDVPKINIVLDELTGRAGLETRVESFVEMLA